MQCDCIVHTADPAPQLREFCRTRGSDSGCATGASRGEGLVACHANSTPALRSGRAADDPVKYGYIYAAITGSRKRKLGSFDTSHHVLALDREKTSHTGEHLPEYHIQGSYARTRRPADVHNARRVAEHGDDVDPGFDLITPVQDPRDSRPYATPVAVDTYRP